MDGHPVRLVVEDDYGRNRLTVFFRLLLAIPHLVWFFLWTILIVVTAIANWLISLFTGRPPGGLHRLMCSYVRYQAHLTAYLSLAANPYPGFAGEEGEYPVDIRLPAEPQEQPRWTILIRIVLAIPALLVSAALAGSTGGSFSAGRGRKTERANGGGAPGFMPGGFPGGGPPPLMPGGSGGAGNQPPDGPGARHLRLYCEGDAAGLVSPVVRTLGERGATLADLQLGRPSLEDVFIHLTGRGLRG